MLTFCLTSIIVIFLDQIIKLYTASNFQLMESQKLIPGFIEWLYIHNDGAGWGMLSGERPLFLLLTVVFSIYIIYLAWKNRWEASYIHLIYGLLLGGALGNFLDRLRLGYVIDMFHFTFIDFPIFNLADAALTIGIILLIAIIIFRKDSDHIL